MRIAKATEATLHAVVGKIKEAHKTKAICLDTFEDIEGAFDETNLFSIQSALRRHVMDKMMTN